MSVNVKGNPVVIALVFVLVFGTFYVLVNGSDDTSVTKTDVDTHTQSEQTKGAQSIPYDTNNEAISSLNGYVANVENKSKQLSDKLDKISESISEENIQRIVQATLSQQPDSSIDVKQLALDVAQTVKAQISDELGKGKEIASNNVDDVDRVLADWTEFKIGENPPGKVDPANAEKPKGASDYGAWVMPLGYEQIDGTETGDFITNAWGDTKSQFDRTFDTINGGKQVDKSKGSNGSTSSTRADAQPLLPLVPYGTLHADSMLFGATSLNSLFGRFERKSKVTDAYEFTVMLSADTLMANGFSFPNIENAMASGVAVGDRALSCVRGDITSFTFVFSDGRIFQQRSKDAKNPLAKIGDEWGNLCVRGMVVDDVESYVTMQAAIAGLSKYSEAIEQQQSTITATNTSMVSTLTGSAGKQAAGSMASGALDSVAAVLAERYDSYYDGVYVMPGAKLSLRLSENINIDYDPNGRFVSYDQVNSNTIDHYSFD
ncbi:hypothetical protein [Vibrio fluvialis]|uniref:hypothetical protein n=1 Tax=Vibrio fluvialis TaxID=676 RepID=UPI00192B67CD|nr:hypothetical protein [Vibrio fluvialis]MBL4262820.1 hypothetical protein [Vibrio fluvialis]